MDAFGKRNWNELELIKQKHNNNYKNNDPNKNIKYTNSAYDNI